MLKLQIMYMEDIIQVFPEKAMYGFRVTVVFHLKLTLLKMECIILRYVHGNILMKQEESSLIA